MPLEFAGFVGQLNAGNPDGTADDINEGDDHIRLIKQSLLSTFPGLTSKFGRVQAKSSNYTLQPNDIANVFNVTGTGVTVSTVGAAIVGNGFFCTIIATNAPVTFDPLGSELVSGGTSLTIPQGSAAHIQCDGSQWLAQVSTSKPDRAIGSQISGDTVLVRADLNQLKFVNNAATITLPTNNQVGIGDYVIIRNQVSRRVIVQAPAGDSIDTQASVQIPHVVSVTFTHMTPGYWLCEGMTSYVGEVREIRGNVPIGWLGEDATVLDRTIFGGLFNVIGTTYNLGDEAGTQFRLPDSRGKSLVGAGLGAVYETFGPAQVSGNNIIVRSNTNRWNTGDSVNVSPLSGSLPPGLGGGGTFYIFRNAANTVQLATSPRNATLGQVIALSGQGSGLFRITSHFPNYNLGDDGGQWQSVTMPDIYPHTHAMTDHQHVAGDAPIGGHTFLGIYRRTSKTTGVGVGTAFTAPSFAGANDPVFDTLSTNTAGMLTHPTTGNTENITYTNRQTTFSVARRMIKV